MINLYKDFKSGAYDDYDDMEFYFTTECNFGAGAYKLDYEGIYSTRCLLKSNIEYQFIKKYADEAKTSEEFVEIALKGVKESDLYLDDSADGYDDEEPFGPYFKEEPYIEILVKTDVYIQNTNPVGIKGKSIRLDTTLYDGIDISSDFDCDLANDFEADVAEFTSHCLDDAYAEQGVSYEDRLNILIYKNPLEVVDDDFEDDYSVLKNGSHFINMDIDDVIYNQAIDIWQACADNDIKDHYYGSIDVYFTKEVKEQLVVKMMHLDKYAPSDDNKDKEE